MGSLLNASGLRHQASRPAVDPAALGGRREQANLLGRLVWGRTERFLRPPLSRESIAARPGRRGSTRPRLGTAPRHR